MIGISIQAYIRGYTNIIELMIEHKDSDLDYCLKCACARGNMQMVRINDKNSKQIMMPGLLKPALKWIYPGFSN